MDSVCVEVDGETYTGVYSVRGGMLVVTFAGASKEMRVGGMSQQIVARQLLRELVREQGGTS
jgi:hypothetical protein